jgi:ribokinase
MQKPIVVVGSINLDLVVGTDRIPQVGETVMGSRFNTFCGGKGANQAVAVAKLGYPVSLVGNVGNDTFGRKLRQGLEDGGVDTTCVNTVEGPSGVALITTARRGENSIVVVPGANAQLTPTLLKKATPTLESAGFLLVQLEIPLGTVEYLAQFAEQHRIPLMLDPAPALELSRNLLGKVSWITPNETEIKELLKTDPQDGGPQYDEAAKLLRDRGAENVLLKLGSHGCIIAQRNLPQELIPAFSVKAVDTTAAGDAFNAGFAVGLMHGRTVTQSAVLASAVAAISTTRVGAQPSMPTFSEVMTFLSERLGQGSRSFATAISEESFP